MRVTDVTVNTFWKGEVQVQGVALDETDKYRVKLYIKGSQIIDYSCSCAAGNSCKGVCIHGKALFEAYESRAREENKKHISTSPVVRSMIKEYTNREVAGIMGEDEAEQVSLVPKLILNKGSVSLECSIGRKRMYQIKDLAAFADAVENGLYVEYGKGLAFYHSHRIFGEECGELVRFITGLAGAYRSHRETAKGFGTVQSSLRSLPLERGARDRFFAMEEGRALLVEDMMGHERSVRLLRANPPLTVLAEAEGMDGIRVSVPDTLTFFAGENSLYVLWEDMLYRCDEAYTQALSIFLEQLAFQPGRRFDVQVNKRDIPLFYERVLKGFEELGILKTEGICLEEYRPEKLKARFEFDSSRPQEVSMTPVLSYGDFSFHPLEDEKVHNSICRDVPEEFRISRLITRYFKYKEDGSRSLVIRDDEDAIYRLLDEGIGQFQAVGDVYLSESFQKLKILPPPSISVGVSMDSGWLELTVDADGMSRQDLARVLTEYNRKKKYYRLKNGEFLKLDDEGLVTVSALAEGLSIGKTELSTGKIRLDNYRALYVDSIIKKDSGITYQRDKRFRQVVRAMKSVEDSSYEIPGALSSVLRQYQKNGFRWLKSLEEYGFGGILADDMGLGKTVQMIALILDRKLAAAAEPDPVCRSLIVCPASLIYNWCREFSVFAPELKVLPVTGTLSERKKALEALEQYDVAVTSYELLKRDLALYQNMSFAYEVLDEAQYIKNASTQTARAVKHISARSKFALTGTPVENRLSELWSIFDFLMPGFLFSYRKFKTMFEVPIVKDGDKRALDNLRRMTAPFVLRRLKTDVLKELPEKLEKIVYSSFEGKQKEIYAGNALRLKESIEAGGMSAGGSGKLQILSELTRLRQICCDPSLCYEKYDGGSAKLETCMDLLKGAVSAGHKILLFSQFASMLEIIEHRLIKEGLTLHKLTGSTTKEERNRMVTSFQSDEVPIFLISLKAGGTGLNLTAADMVIHYDPWWNVAVQNQATDRAHRIGQSRQVTVYKLIMERTIEENILKLQESKKNLAEQIVTEGMVSLSSMGREELLEILQ